MIDDDKSLSGQTQLLKDIQIHTDRILNYRRLIRDNKGGYDIGIELQKEIAKREALQAFLRRPTVAWVHSDPDSLSPPVRRSKAEIRAFAGLPPIEEE